MPNLPTRRAQGAETGHAANRKMEHTPATGRPRRRRRGSGSRKDARMFTIAFLTKRVESLSESEFFDHYTNVHAPLAVQLPGLVSYQQFAIRHGEEAWLGEPEAFPEHQALSLYTFESRAAADLAFASPEAAPLLADTDVFMDGPTILNLPCERVAAYAPARTETEGVA